MTDVDTVQTLTQYKAWANSVTYAAVYALPEGEALKERTTHFKNIVHTLNHIYVVDRIFQAHLENRPHDYTARNTETTPMLDTLWAAQKTVDQWYVELGGRLTARDLTQPVQFQFVDGGAGMMTRGQIILHVVNHGTYHRGFVGDMLNQAGVVPCASDFTIFLRDAA